MRPSLESDTDAVRAAAVAFAGANPKADRKDVAAYLADEGFGNSRYPIARWLKEAGTLPIQDAPDPASDAWAADAEAEFDGTVLDEDQIVSADAPEKGMVTGPLVDHTPPARRKNQRKAPAPPWKDGSREEIAAHLLARQTIPDRTWSELQSRPRNKGESRSDYIKRQLLGAPEADAE